MIFGQRITVPTLLGCPWMFLAKLPSISGHSKRQYLCQKHRPAKTANIPIASLSPLTNQHESNPNTRSAPASKEHHPCPAQFQAGGQGDIRQSASPVAISCSSRQYINNLNVPFLALLSSSHSTASLLLCNSIAPIPIPIYNSTFKLFYNGAHSTRARGPSARC